MSRLADLLPDVERWGGSARPGRAVVVRTFGSSPWPPGATLLVAADGRLSGTVSGGCVEADAAEEVRRAIETGMSRLLRYGIADADAWDVGLACGGTIELLVEPALRPELLAAARVRDGRAVAVPLPGEAWERPADALVLEADGADARGDGVAARGDGVAARGDGVVSIGGRQHFIEVFAPPQRLVAFGAGEVTRFLAHLATDLGWSVVVVDPRTALLAADRFDHGVQLVPAWPQEGSEQIGLRPADAVAVLTHDPKLDDPAIQLALATGCRYVGAIGSRRTQAERRTRLGAVGVRGRELARVRGPIGLDLGGRAPAETAVAILAEIVAVLNGASARPMAIGD